VRHFLDALSCAAATGPLDGQSLIDIGSGAGFPGLPLKILYPDLRLTLVDSVAKKARFLELVAAELGLREVTVIAERAEVLGQDPTHREQYDWATARAVAELRVLAELLLPLCRVGGRVLAQKGGARPRSWSSPPRLSPPWAAARRNSSPSSCRRQKPRTTWSSSTKPPRLTHATPAAPASPPSDRCRGQVPGQVPGSRFQGRALFPNP
jgi:16S rRNA (guanine(527)-N(7))-methyltransferase RsmG